MKLVPPFLQRLLKKVSGGDGRRTFQLDERFSLVISKMAQEQHKDEDEVVQRILDVGIKEIEEHQTPYAEAWQTLSPREQEVAALLGLGYSSQEIADILVVSYDTVRSHSKHIYVKFDLGRVELRHVLQGWNLEEWWEKHTRR
jgi:DNA-binding CsgD family transcriptional regulator